MSVIPLPVGRKWRPGSSAARVLAVTTELFVETGEWPSVDEVQGGLVEYRDHSDADRRVSRMPGQLGRREQGDRVVLSVCGIHRGDPNNQVLADFEAALVRATRRYRLRGRHRRKATLCAESLTRELSISPLRAERAMALLVSEGLASAGSIDGTVHVTSAIVPYLFVRNVDEYMKKRKSVECQGRRERIRQFPGKVFHWFRGDDASIAAKIAVASLSAVAAALLLAAVTLGVQALQSSGDDQPARKSPAARSGG